MVNIKMDDGFDYGNLADLNPAMNLAFYQEQAILAREMAASNYISRVFRELNFRSKI